MIRSLIRRGRVFFADPESRCDIRNCALLTLVAFALYLPGINWGLPAATAPGTTQSWGPDEIGPIGPIVELRNNLGGNNLGNPQYPMFHYLWIFLFYFPYLAFQYLTGGMPHPHGGYPFGFTDPASSVQMLMRISRIVSVLMGAGMGVTAYLTGRVLWNRLTGFLAALFVLLMYPMFYFGRTSNLDVPVTFWQTLVLLLFALCMKEGRVGAGRFYAIGIIAAICVATKEQSYGILVFLVFPLLAWHFRDARRQGIEGPVARWKLPLLALAASVVLYVFASGLAVRPQKFFRHLDFVRSGSPTGRFYHEYSLTPAGLLGMAHECLDHLVEMMGLPFLLAGLAGLALCVARRELRGSLPLLLPIPGLFFTVLGLAGYVELRYLLPWGWLLSLFGAHAVVTVLRSRSTTWQTVSVLVISASCGWALLRGLELQYLSLNDSRYLAANWIAANARPGDRLAYTGAERRIVLMPRFGDTVATIPVEVPKSPATGPPVFDTEFVLLMGKDDLVDFWWTPQWAYDGLRNGSLGYELVAEFYTPSRLAPQARHDAMQIGVNPHLLLFARRDRAAELRAKSHR